MSTLKFDILKERNALLIFVSQLLTSISDKMLSIGLIWYVTKTLGAIQVSWFLTFAFLPHLLFSFFTPKVIHKLGTIKTVMASEIFRGIVLLIYFFILAFKIVPEESFQHSLFLMAFLIGIGSCFFTPAILSTPPILVAEDKIVAINGLIDSTMSISSILGAVVSIFLLNIFDLKGLILINALCFFIAFIMQLFLRPIKTEDFHEEAITTSPIKILKKYPLIEKMLFCFLIFNLILTPIFVLIPWYVENIYKGDSSSLATIEGCMGIGAFLMGIIISLTHFEVKDNNRIKMISIIMFLFGVLFTAFAFSKITYQGALVLFIIGAISTFFNIQILTYFQTEADPQDVPLIMTAVNLISTASMPISMIMSGIILPKVNVFEFTLISGIIVILLSFVIPSLIKRRVG